MTRWRVVQNPSTYQEMILACYSYSVGSPIKYDARATDGEPTGPEPPRGLSLAYQDVIPFYRDEINPPPPLLPFLAHPSSIPPNQEKKPWGYINYFIVTGTFLCALRLLQQ
ncbi:hypothetical protein AVEN_188844-1 [Araneus ventricosus]|uniref:Uncharacterized protein n=1 Tax=Araneus ventricosus TaxID=182803 RepID=A0A4Y2BSB5_ARAVE|nr:hypothetical protein AVEN_188844-1 [Araneus ventricosus]